MKEIKRKIAVLFLVFALSMPVMVMYPNEVKAESAQTIIDEETPLAAAEDLCIVHWIVLILSVGLGSYVAARVISVAKQKNSEVAKQEA